MPDDPAHFPTQLYDEAAIKRARDLLEAPPVQIGPYRVIERIGGGGMGEVYRAEQRAPIRREVAIKVIKLGMDTKAVIARFEIERQALALMDHPHIAKVLDAGADDSGRPYCDGVCQREADHRLCRPQPMQYFRATRAVRAGLPGDSACPPQGGDPSRPQAEQRPGQHS